MSRISKGRVPGVDTPLPMLHADARPVALVALDARGLEFIIEHLPANDEFRFDLRDLLAEAKQALWEAEAR